MKESPEFGIQNKRELCDAIRRDGILLPQKAGRAAKEDDEVYQIKNLTVGHAGF